MKTVILFDKATIVRKVASQILQSLGFKVIEVVNYDDAIQAFLHESPVCILVDGTLPDNGTLKFVKNIRALPSSDAVKIIYMPLEHDLGKVTRMLREGATDVLLRPFNEIHMREKFIRAGLI